MRVRQVLVCFFLLSFPLAQDGISSPFHEDIGVHKGTRGGNIRVRCNFKVSGRRKIFCRNDCTNRNILVETTGVSEQTGRYRIEYKKSPTVIYVSITNLEMTDSGKYTCWLDRFGPFDSTETFELIVEDKTTTSKPSWTSQPSTTKSTPSTPSTSTLTTWWSSSSTTRSTTPSSLSTDFTQESGGDSGLPLYLGLTLLLLVLILSAILFVFWMKRKRKPKGPPPQTEYVNTHNVNRMYEEIREKDRQNRPPPSNVTTVYAQATFVKPNKTETTDEYSLITMATSQNMTEKDSSNLTYSEVDFSKSQAASPNSAHSGEADRVIYSETRVGVDSDDRKNPLYSTVSLH